MWLIVDNNIFSREIRRKKKIPFSIVPPSFLFHSSVRSNSLRFPRPRNNTLPWFFHHQNDEARATFRKSVVSRHRWRRNVRLAREKLSTVIVFFFTSLLVAFSIFKVSVTNDTCIKFETRDAWSLKRILFLSPPSLLEKCTRCFVAYTSSRSTTSLLKMIIRFEWKFLHKVKFGINWDINLFDSFFVHDFPLKLFPFDIVVIIRV